MNKNDLAKKALSSRLRKKENNLKWFHWPIIIWPFIFCIFITLPRNPKGFGGDQDWGLPFHYCYDMNDVVGEEIDLIYLSLNILIACLLSKMTHMYLQVKDHSLGSKIITFTFLGSSVLFFSNDKIPHGLPRYSSHHIYLDACDKVFLDYLDAKYSGNKKCLFLVSPLNNYQRTIEKLSNSGFTVKEVVSAEYSFFKYEDFKQILLSNPEYDLVVTTEFIELRESLKELVAKKKLQKLPVIVGYGWGVNGLLSKSVFEDKLILAVFTGRFSKEDLSGLDMNSPKEEIFNRLYDLVTADNYLNKTKEFPTLLRETSDYFEPDKSIDEDSE